MEFFVWQWDTVDFAAKLFYKRVFRVIIKKCLQK